MMTKPEMKRRLATIPHDVAVRAHSHIVGGNGGNTVKLENPLSTRQVNALFAWHSLYGGIVPSATDCALSSGVYDNKPVGPAMPEPHLTIRNDKGAVVTNVYILKPGAHFPGFGGSRHGLTVGKTPSLITRSYAGGGISDIEYDVHNAGVWAWIARLINENGRGGMEITAAGPKGAEG